MSTTHPTPPPPEKRPASRRWLTLGLPFVALCLATLLAGGSLWWWAGNEGSLATVLAQVSRWLPAGQTLEARVEQGTLRRGGRIAWLRWSSPRLIVKIDNAHLEWRLEQLLERKLQWGETHIERITLSPGPEPSDDQPSTPPASLSLPLQIDLPLRIDHLQWTGPGSVEAYKLRAHYGYDGSHHRLALANLELAQGRYSAEATLQPAAPMALQVSAQGHIETQGLGPGPAITLEAQASLQGELAPAHAPTEARLALQTRLQPHPSGRPQGPPGTPPMQAELSATLMPWAQQPLHSVQAQLQAIDLSALWPQAPRTQLQGRIQAGPQSTGWALELQLRNTQPGPWDQGRLPLDALRARATLDGTTWRISEATAQRGAGQIAGQGQYQSDTGTFEGEAQLKALNPAQLHSALDAAPLQGQIQATAAADASANFTVNLHAAPQATAEPRGASLSKPLRIQSLQTQGSWAPQTRQIRLQRLSIHALGVQVQGNALEIALKQPGAKGSLQVTVPGASAQAQGELSALRGAGMLQLQIAEANRMQAWLKSLPGLGQTLPQLDMQGKAQLHLQWQGGWQALLHPKPTPQANDFSLQTSLDIPEWHIAWPAQATKQSPQQAWRLQGIHATLAGSSALATLAVEGTASTGDQQFTLSSRTQGGWQSTGPGSHVLRAQLQTMRLQASTVGTGTAPWSVNLTQAVPLAWRPGARNAATLIDLGAGQAQITAPLPGQATLLWQASELRIPASGPLQVQTRGELQGVPLAWAQVLPGAAEPAADWAALDDGLRLNGRWDVQITPQQLRASASLQRASGDLRVQSGEAPAPPQLRGRALGSSSSTAQAGVRQLRLAIDAVDRDVRASLQWDSERAGQLEASVSTRIQPPGRVSEAGSPANTASLWPANAPLSGTLRARLPDLGAWSALAPPGWRVRGTLHADATLSGQRNAPRWQGTVAADGFTLRSLADGIDLQNGRLRATLDGSRLQIKELLLHGSPARPARIAGYSGNRTAAAGGDNTLQAQGELRWTDATESAAAHITMDITAQARALQVLSRADRQINVSGPLRAQLTEGRLRLSGELTVDRAAILLPNETAPSLGQDVVVRSAAASKKARTPTDRQARAAPRQLPDIALTLHLGDDFALQGHGITTRLKGSLQVRSSTVAAAPPNVTGEIRTEQGRYQAWGQTLDVETGLIRFNGAYDNPSLDILALRPLIPVRAGVQITGTAHAPRVQLYADPDLPDAEKLSWVVLGREPTGGGAQTALLQQAALALLGNRGNAASANVANRLGVDEIGFKGASSGNNASAAALTLGKRISQDLYITYERSLSGAMGSLYIFYDLSRRLTLRGQTGAQSALDIVYTVRHD